MKTIILYKSQTGFTKRYAEMIAERIGCPAKELKGATAALLSDYERIVYGGRLHAGIIDGLKRAKALYRASTARELVVFATGGTPSDAEKLIGEVWQNNFSAEERAEIPHFYMQAGICYERMGPLDKALMKLAAKMMRANKEASAEAGFAQALTGSYDISSPEYIEPLVAHLQGE